MIRKGSVHVLIGMVCICMLLLSAAPRGTANAQEAEFVVGGLFSLTGNLQALGQSSKTAMEIAVEDANTAAKSKGLAIRFTPLIYDTKLDPAKAVEGIQMMAGKGIRFVVGPQSSSELVAIKSFADGRNIVVISQSSTAGSLAVAKDNIFRFCPSDEVAGLAVATFMRRDGIKTVVPVWRDDPGNAGIQEAVRKAATAAGIKVVEGVKYAAAQKDYKSVTGAIAAQVEAAVGRSDVKSVAIFLAGFDEVAAILADASGNEKLGAVRWYGSDGGALNKVVISDPKASAFAEKVKYQCPIFGTEENSRLNWSSVISRIEKRAGTQTDGYALAVYDAVRVIAQTYISLGGKVSDPESLKGEFIKSANAFRGVTGRTVLNAAGDRKYGTYDFWAIVKGDGGYQWKRVGSYESE